MSKTLTEQWREEKLPEDCYYILTKDGHIKKERTCFYSHIDGQCFSFTDNRDIEEVLAPVPSYDEYLVLSGFKKIEKYAIDDIVKIHTEKLGKRLEIATKALKYCYNDMKYWAVLTRRNQRILNVIKQALKEMKGVK